MSFEHGVVDMEIIREFLAEPLIPIGIKLGDYLPVVLGIRRAAQIVMPAELPDAEILGATIDDMYKRKLAGERLPGESLGGYFRGRFGKRWRRSPLQEVRYRSQVLRDLYEDIVVGSHSYQAFEKWAAAFSLRSKALESRPTIRELYLFTEDQVGSELAELQEMRKDIRYHRMRVPDTSAQPFARAFPEEFNSGFLRRQGEILGFPPCCIDRFVFDRSSRVLTPEARASSQLESIESPDEISSFAYAVKDFFPCQPDCPSAAELGRSIHKGLAEVDPEIADEYEKHLSGNIALIRGYPEIIRRRIEVLEEAAGRGDREDNEPGE